MGYDAINLGPGGLMKSLYLDKFKAVIRYHEIAGDGPTIVYLAAVAFPSLPTFLPVATHPSMRSHHSVFVDYFGVGHSEHPSDFDHSLQNHAKTVASILDHEGLRDCVVVGHSMGGTVAIYLAMQRPDLVSHLVVCEGNIATGGGVGTRYFTSVSEAEFVSTFFPNFRRSPGTPEEMATNTHFGAVELGTKLILLAFTGNVRRW